MRVFFEKKKIPRSDIRVKEMMRNSQENYPRRMKERRMLGGDHSSEILGSVSAIELLIDFIYWLILFYEPKNMH